MDVHAKMALTPETSIGPLVRLRGREAPAQLARGIPCEMKVVIMANIRQGPAHRPLCEAWELDPLGCEHQSCRDAALPYSAVFNRGAPRHHGSLSNHSDRGRPTDMRASIM